jgi:mono/diheme cytochrome c family protein
MRSQALVLSVLAPLAGCAVDTFGPGGGPPDPADEVGDLANHLESGRDVWFENTYGGEKFFAFLKQHPDPQKRIDIGFLNVATTPRANRFELWGVINDPDCTANPDGGMDLCDDPTSSGVIGIKKTVLPDGRILFGTTCASCHAGFDPLDPPDDPAEPEWDNIHATIGNQYLQIGRIFAANLPASDPRTLIFAAWPPGAVDTTLLFDDGIMNPGVITHFWAHKHRPAFEVGREDPQLRNGQGGEDDLGGDIAAMRVYTNIGVCFQECVAPAVVTGTPISIDACRASCPDFPPQEDLDDLGAFLASFEAPQYPGYAIKHLHDYGRSVFDASCAGCHARTGDLAKTITNDEINPLAVVGDQATNACRVLTTNWEEGKLWAEFSSDVYKDRVAAGDRGYRTMPLAGIWATAPFLHNQSVGTRPPADASVHERAAAYRSSMWELLSADREEVIHRIPVAVGPFPAGTPTRFVFSTPDPATGQARCMDFVENRGHTYGADLSIVQKTALIYWLQYQ